MGKYNDCKELIVCMKSVPEVKVCVIVLQKPATKDKFFNRAAQRHISHFHLGFCKDGLNGPGEEGDYFNLRN